MLIDYRRGFVYLQILILYLPKKLLKKNLQIIYYVYISLL